jgi:hypothetical protein
LKVELALAGVLLSTLIGWLIGALLEHPPGPGGLQVVGSLLGAMVALVVLILGEALRTEK